MCFFDFVVLYLYFLLMLFFVVVDLILIFVVKNCVVNRGHLSFDLLLYCCLCCVVFVLSSTSPSALVFSSQFT